MELFFNILVIFWLYSKLLSADLKKNLDLISKCALEARAFQLACCCLQLGMCILFLRNKMKSESYKSNTIKGNIKL